jgi:hypothetical protein
MLVETQDLLRGIVACHRAMTLAPLALLVRTSFEIHCNLRYVIRSSDPARMADLFDRFGKVEKITGMKASAATPDPSPADWDNLKRECPEWFDSKTGKIVDQPHWTTEKTNLRKMASSPGIDLESDYVALYKTTSKFTHASPLVANMYRKANGLQCIPSSEQNSQFGLLGAHNCLKILEEFIDFFGVPWPKIEVMEMNIDCLCAEDLIKGIRYPDLDTARAAVIKRIAEQAKLINK